MDDIRVGTKTIKKHEDVAGGAVIVLDTVNR
jgi:hypothetical protein